MSTFEKYKLILLTLLVIGIFFLGVEMHIAKNEISQNLYDLRVSVDGISSE